MKDQRDDSPLRTLFGYGKDKNLPDYHSRTQSSNDIHTEQMQKYIRSSTTIDYGSATPWQKLIHEIDHNREESVNVLGHKH